MTQKYFGSITIVANNIKNCQQVKLFPHFCICYNVYMLKSTALANAFTAATLILYFAFYILQIFAPPFFRLMLNSQFLGADLASSVPKPNFINFLGVLIAVGLLAWVFGYLVGRIYNHLAS